MNEMNKPVKIVSTKLISNFSGGLENIALLKLKPNLSKAKTENKKINVEIGSM